MEEFEIVLILERRPSDQTPAIDIEHGGGGNETIYLKTKGVACRVESVTKRAEVIDPLEGEVTF